MNKNKLKMIYNGIDLERIKLMANDKIVDYEEVFDNPQIIKYFSTSKVFIFIIGRSKIFCKIRKIKDWIDFIDNYSQN